MTACWWGRSPSGERPNRSQRYLPKTQNPEQEEENHNKKAATSRSPPRPVAILPRNALAVVARVDVRLTWVRLLTKTVILAPPPVVGAAVADSPLRVGRRRRRLLGLARSERPRVLGTDSAQDAACARTRRREAASMASGGYFFSSEAQADWLGRGLRGRQRRKVSVTETDRRGPRTNKRRETKDTAKHSPSSTRTVS